MNVERATARAQAALFVGGGLWSVLHRRSFEAVTGPKVDYWLVRTVGLLLATIGGVVWGAAERGRLTRELRLLGGASAAALFGIDVVYAVRRRIRPIYLVDAVAEAAIVAGWARTSVGT